MDLALINEFVNFMILLFITKFFFDLIVTFISKWDAAATIVNNKTVTAAAKEANELLNAFHNVEEEHSGDMYYWYDKDTGKFLSQGRTFEEMTATLGKLYPTHMFIFEENGKKVIACAPNFVMVPFDGVFNEDNSIMITDKDKRDHG